MNQEPSTLLLDHLHLLSKGRVLDVAMGKGRNAIYLAKHGFDVEGVDIDEKAVSACVAEAKTTYGIIGVKVWIFRGEVNQSEKTN